MSKPLERQSIRGPRAPPAGSGDFQKGERDSRMRTQDPGPYFPLGFSVWILFSKRGGSMVSWQYEYVLATV